MKLIPIVTMEYKLTVFKKQGGRLDAFLGKVIYYLRECSYIAKLLVENAKQQLSDTM